MLRVAVSGATGKVGRMLVPAVEAAPDLELVGTAAPSLGRSLADVLRASRPDVAVDFTVPDVAAAACEAAVQAGVPLVLGTTGLPAEARAQVDAAARAGGVPLLYAPNFALGAVLMLRFAAQAARVMDACEVVELHADTKRDAPSGTALATREAVGGDVPIHSVRLPGLVAHQEVLFGAPGQLLTIRHDATSRDAFVPGVLLAVRRIHGLPPGLTVGLDAVLERTAEGP